LAKKEQKYWDTLWKIGLKNDMWDEGCRQEMIALLNEIMAKNDCQNLLDVGCGKPALREVRGYVGLDFPLKALRASRLVYQQMEDL